MEIAFGTGSAHRHATAPRASRSGHYQRYAWTHRSRVEDFIVAWSDVVRVSAWKENHMVVDRIMLGLGKSDGSMLVVHEEMTGYSELLEAMRVHLPGFDSTTWPREIAFPAFARNERTVWSRAPIA